MGLGCRCEGITLNVFKKPPTEGIFLGAPKNHAIVLHIEMSKLILKIPAQILHDNCLTIVL